MNRGFADAITHDIGSAGGTISGDVTIDGDLTVNGDGGFAYSEVLTGDFQIVGANGTVSGTADVDGDEFIIRNNADAGMSILAGESSGHTSSIIFGSANDLNGANVFYEYHSKTLKLGTQHASGILTLRSGNGTDALTLDSSQNATFAGQVKVTSSNASTVALSVGDAGTGWYNTGSNAIGLSINGTQKLAVDNSGNVTITNTDALLNLTSGATNDSVIRFNQDTTQQATIGYDDTGDLLKINNNSNFGGTNHLVINDSGDIGIGGTPDVKLHIMTSDASLTTADANASVIIEENDHTYL